MHRFLSYTFPRRLPDPARLVVPDRPGVVRTAPTLPGVPRLGLSSASPASCDWPVEGPFHPFPVSHPSASEPAWGYSTYLAHNFIHRYVWQADVNPARETWTWIPVPSPALHPDSCNWVSICQGKFAIAQS
jgi:hypothetical protein